MNIPAPIHSTPAAIYAAIEAAGDQSPRLHLGASEIGHHCERWLWLRFRWAVSERFSGRMLRLFRRGQDEEDAMAADMRAAGMEVIQTDDEGRQFRVSLRPHFSGSMDGIIRKGVPEAPNKPHIWECKTTNKKGFDALERAGVKKEKPQHWAQMQIYMGAKDIDRALYVCVCKDDDRIYAERVRFDCEAFDALKARAERIITSDRMLEPVSGDPTWYQCKFCAAHSICHKGEPVREVNCRTCAHVTFDDGVFCERWNAPIPAEVQREGCRSHVMNPYMVPWKFVDGDGVNAVYEIQGERVTNGEGGADSRSLISAEAHHAS